MNRKSSPVRLRDQRHRALVDTQPLPESPARVAQQIPESDIHILHRLGVLYRYREISLAVFVLTSVAFLIQGYTSLQLFQAQGRLLIDREPAETRPRQDSAQHDEGPQAYYDTQYKIIKGRDLTRRVVRTLHLERYPEFNGTPDPAHTFFRLLAGLEQRVVSLTQPASTGTGSGSVGAATDEARLIDRFIDLVDVKRVPDSQLVDVTFNSIDSRFSALAVNTVMDEYVNQTLTVKIAATDTAGETERRVAGDSRANIVRIVDRAEPPRTPMSPVGPRTWLMSLAIGLAASIAVAFGLSYMDDTIKTPEDIDERLNLPVLALVPSVRGDPQPLLASSRVPNDFGESFRALRTSLLLKYSAPGTKLLVVTSARPLEGKTIVAANMAMALAYGGARVLLIDADMRRPGLHRPLRLSNECGLAQALNGQARVRDIIQRTADPNLLAITAGRTPPNPSELLSSERMRALLANLVLGAFDWIVIDTPPVLTVTDAVILAPSVAGVVYVIGAEMTRRRLAERALATILSAHPRSVFAVLNKVDFSRNKSNHSRYHALQHKNYYPGAASI